MARVFIKKLQLVQDHHLDGAAKILLVDVNLYITHAVIGRNLFVQYNGIYIMFAQYLLYHF